MTRAVDSESGGFSTWGVGVAVGENFNAIDSGLTFCSQIVTVCSTNVRELHTWQFQRFDISTKQDHGYSERLQRTKFHTYTWFNVFFTRTLPRKHVLVLTDLFSLVTPSDSIRTSKRQFKIKTHCDLKFPVEQTLGFRHAARLPCSQSCRHGEAFGGSSPQIVLQAPQIEAWITINRLSWVLSIFRVSSPPAEMQILPIENFLVTVLRALTVLVWPLSIKSIYRATWAKHGNCLTANDNPGISHASTALQRFDPINWRQRSYFAWSSTYSSKQSNFTRLMRLNTLVIFASCRKISRLKCFRTFSVTTDSNHFEMILKKNCESKISAYYGTEKNDNFFVLKKSVFTDS